MEGKVEEGKKRGTEMHAMFFNISKETSIVLKWNLRELEKLAL